MNENNRTASVPGYYMEFVANVVRQLPRPEVIDQAVVEGWNNNQKSLKEALAKALLPNEIMIDSRFKILNSFELTVPTDYVHKTQLASFSKKHKKEFYYFNDAVTDENFTKVTDKLVPSKTYGVKIFQITKPVSSDDCLEFLKTQKAILVGVQGISLMWEYKKEEFPISKWTVSFDEKDALWKDADGNRRVPYVRRFSDGDWYFGLDHFAGYWDDAYCVLCFRDLS